MEAWGLVGWVIGGLGKFLVCEGWEGKEWEGIGEEGLGTYGTFVRNALPLNVSPYQLYQPIIIRI